MGFVFSSHVSFLPNDLLMVCITTAVCWLRWRWRRNGPRP